MTPTPSGRLVGRDLILTRTFRASPEDVWASVTEPERTARWIGPWSGEGGAGSTIRLTMGFEDDAPVCDARIDECEPPHRLGISLLDDSGTWRMTVEIDELDGISELRLTHHLDDPAMAPEVGPGWEYYLDNLVAARDGAPLPSFDDYVPAHRSHYEGEVAAARA